MENRLKMRLQNGEPALGIQLRFGSPAIAELAGLAGFDWVLIDTEHAPQTPTAVQAQLQAVGCTAATPIVRAAKNDPDLIKLYLDMGAMGIAVPFISTPEEARIGAAACRYPPRGTRGWGPHRAAGYGLFADAYTQQIDDCVLFFPIIETAEAIDHIDAIMDVDGVDGCIVGPVDLCIALGIPFQMDHPDYRAALARVRAAAQRTGKPGGLPVTGPLDDRAHVRQQVEQCGPLLLVGGDESYLMEACRRAVANFAPLKD